MPIVEQIEIRHFREYLAAIFYTIYIYTEVCILKQIQNDFIQSPAALDRTLFARNNCVHRTSSTSSD